MLHVYISSTLGGDECCCVYPIHGHGLRVDLCPPAEMPEFAASEEEGDLHQQTHLPPGGSVSPQSSETIGLVEFNRNISIK